jgi:hypothetical protein
MLALLRHEDSVLVASAGIETDKFASTGQADCDLGVAVMAVASVGAGQGGIATFGLGGSKP